MNPFVPTRPVALMGMLFLGAFDAFILAQVHQRESTLVQTSEEFRSRFCRRLDEIPTTPSPSADGALVDLVARNPWHAVPAATAWITELDPATTTKTPKELLRRRAFTIGEILKTHHRAPGVLEVVHAVDGWSKLDWESFRRAEAAYRDADTAYGSQQWAESLSKLAPVAERYLQLGRSVRAANALRRRTRCLLSLQRYEEARDCARQELPLRERVGDLRMTARSHADLSEAFYGLGEWEQSLHHLERGIELRRDIPGEEPRVAKYLESGANSQLMLGRVDAALAWHERLEALRQKASLSVDLTPSSLGAEFGFRFLAHLREVQSGEDPTRDSGLRSLVTRQPHHAVNMALLWLHLLNTRGWTPTPSVLLGHLEVLGQFLAESHGTPGVLATARRMIAWSRDEWIEHRRLRSRLYGSTPKTEDDYRRLLESLRSLGEHVDLSNGCVMFGRYLRSAKPEAALKCFQEAYDISSSWGTIQGKALGATNLGLVQMDLGRLSEAHDSLAEALKLNETDPLRPDTGWAHHNLALVHRSRGDAELARLSFERSHAAFVRTKDLAGQAAHWHELGEGHRRVAEYKEAHDCLTKALALGRRAGDWRQVARTLTKLGDVQRGLGQISKARGTFTESLELWSKLGDRLEIAWARKNLAVVAADPRSALMHLEAAVEGFKEAGATAALTGALNQLGVHYFYLGDTERAGQIWHRALEKAREGGDEASVPALLTNLGNLFERNGQLKEAIRYHEEALARGEAYGPRHRAICLHNLGGLYVKIGDVTRGEKHLQEALAIKRDIDDPETLFHTLWAFGGLCRKRGQHSAALEYYREALAAAIKVNDDWAGQLRCELARSLLDAGSLVEARNEARRALENLREVRQDLGADLDRIAYQEGRQWCLTPLLEVATASDRENERDDKLAFLAVESIKGLATAALLASPGFESNSESNETTTHRTIRAQLVDNQRRLNVLRRDPDGNGNGQGSTAENVILRRLEEKEKALEQAWQDSVRTLQRENPRYSSVVVKPPELQRFVSMLPSRTAYLSYAVGKEKSFLVVVDSAGLRTYSLPPEESIDAAVEAYLVSVRHRPERTELAEQQRKGVELCQLLLGGLERDRTLDQYDTLLISPHGALSALPFQTLVRRMTPNGSGDARFLVQSHRVLCVHSGTAWMLHCDRMNARHAEYRNNTQPAPHTAVIMGDPVGPDEREAPSKGIVLSFAAERGELGRLPFTRREVHRVVKALLGERGLDEALQRGVWRLVIDGAAVEREEFRRKFEDLWRLDPEVRHASIQGPNLDIRLGAAANRGALLDPTTLAQARLIHIAAHARIFEANPGLSGIVLSASFGDPGYLRMMDLLSVDLRAALVVLSGCETQLGRRTVGEGHQGLVRALLFAGAENVIASSWRVSDQSTADLLPNVYRFLVDDNLTPVEALRRAQLTYLESIPPTHPEERSPYYWGPWTLWGTGGLAR